jgi:hypothetical protein
LKSELQRLKTESAETKAYIDAQQSEERKLLKIIQEADAERLRQKKQLEQASLEHTAQAHIKGRMSFSSFSRL